MKTKYDLKSLKLLGAMFAVLFTVFMFSSYKAEAQTVSVAGPSQVCVGPAVAVYVASQVGFTSPTYTWYYSVHGDPTSGNGTSEFAIEWNDPTCVVPVPDPKTTANWAYVRVVVQELANPAISAQDIFFVDLYDGDFTLDPIDPILACEDADEIPIAASDPECGLILGAWKTDPPGQLIFDDPYAFETDVLGAAIDPVDLVTGTFEVGVYTLVWAVSNGPCGVYTETTTLEIFAMPEVEIVADGLTELCFGDEVDLMATVTSALTYNIAWYKDDELIVGAASDTYTASESGVYYAEVQFADDPFCGPVQSNSITVTVSDLESVAIEPAGPVYYCEDEFVDTDLEAITTVNDPPSVGTITYQWYHDGTEVGTSKTYTALDFGTYTVTVTADLGTISCTVTSEPMEIIAWPLPDFEVEVADVCFGEDVVASVINLNNAVTPTFTWYLNGGLFPDDTQTITNTAPAVGVYTLVATVENENGCTNTVTETFEVFPLPEFEIEGPAELCFNEPEVLTITNTANFCSPNVVTWWVDGIWAGTFTDTYTYLFDPADWGVVTVTSEHEVTAQVVNCNGCASEIVSHDITILGQPYITKNEILPPLYNGEVKTVWCSTIPAGLVIRGEDDVEWLPIPPNESCDVEYRWLKSTASIGGGLGVTWISTGFGADDQRHYTLPQLTETTWYKRQARLISCECDPYDPPAPDWHDSNIIEMVILEEDHFAVEVDASADICLGGTITLTATPTPMYATGGEWTYTGPGELTFTPDEFDPNASIVADMVGEYELTWFYTEEAIVESTSCGGPVHSGTLTVVFQGVAFDIVEANLGLDTDYCVYDDPVTLVLPDVVLDHPGTVYTLTVTGDGVTCASPCTFDPESAGVGTHVILVEAVTDGGCVVTTTATVTVHPRPEAPIADNLEVCYDGDPHTATAAPGAGGVSVVYYTSQFGSTTTTAPTRTLPGTTTAWAESVSAAGCVSEFRTEVYVTVNHTPVASIGNITDPYYDDDLTINGSHVSATPSHAGLASYDWEVSGTEGSTSGTTGPHTSNSSFTFDTQLIGIGPAVVTLTVTYDLYPTYCSDVVTRTFDVLPPWYAMFSPTYVTDRSVEHPFDATASDYIVEDVPIEIDLSIAFNRAVRTVNNQVLPTNDLGDFVTFQVYDGGWVTIPFNSTRSGNMISVFPQSGDLEYNNLYRIGFNNIYRPGTGLNPGPNVVYTLDAESVDPVVFDEMNTSAYELDNMVYFRTITECDATLPTVFPTGDEVSICADNGEIRVEFVNPVGYLSGAEFGTEDSPQHKFKLQKYDGGWVDIDFDADADDFVPGVGPMTIILTPDPDQMLYCTEYRVLMNKFDGPAPFEYGFIDMVNGCNVLGADNPDHYVQIDGTTILPLGWTWTTTCEYDLLVDVVPWPVDEYGDRDDNLNNVKFSNSFPNLITYPYDPISDTYDMVKQTDPYVVPNPGSTFTMSAFEGEGYHWTHWSRSFNGGGSFTNLASTPPFVNPQNGVNWFDQEFPWNPATLAPDCDEDLVYRAHFAKNTYTVNTTAVDCLGEGNYPERGTITGGGSGKVHGTTVVITATPAAGYYINGFDYDVPTNFNGSIVENVPVLAEIMDPTQHSATLTIVLEGDMEHLDIFDVRVRFCIFQPMVYAAAQGTDYDEEVVPNITDIEFTTLFVSNILTTGVEDADIFTPDGLNDYEWAMFVYGNPNGVGAHFPVTVEPLDVPCQYTFIKWERWNPETEMWFDVSTDLVYSFIPTQNYRLRAIFEWKNDIAISVDNDVLVNSDPAAMGSILIEQGGDNWFNSPTPKDFSPGEVLTITVYPEPEFFTYGFVDEFGNQIPVYTGDDEVGGIMPNPVRYNDNNVTVWEYVVGCWPVNLRAVIGVKRFFVQADAVTIPAAGQSIPPYGGTVGTSTPGSVQLPDFDIPMLFGFWDEDDATDGLGFVDSNSGRTTAGWFEPNTALSMIAVKSSSAPATQNWVFDGWFIGATQVSPDEVYNRLSIYGDLYLTARFRNTYVPPTGNVMLADNPMGTAYQLTGAGAYTAGQSFTVATRAHSGQPFAQPGWEFSHWTASGISLTPFQSTQNPLTLSMPGHLPNITLTANFQEIEVDLAECTRTMLRTPGINSFPYTNGNPYIVGETLGSPVFGGTIDIPDGPYIFDDVVTITVTPNPGFRLINVMIGEDEGQGVFHGVQINPFDGMTVYPGFYTFDYKVPAQYADEITICAIFGQASDPMFPAYNLITQASPVGFGDTYANISEVGGSEHGGTFAHGTHADIWEEVVMPGYEFSHWTLQRGAGMANGLLLDGQMSSDNTVDMVGGAVGQTFVATAHYTAIEYDLYIASAHAGYGEVRIANGMYSPSDVTTYTIEDDPFSLQARSPYSDEDECFIYTFDRFTYDAAGLIPVVDNSVPPADVTNPFFFIPVIPEPYMTDLPGTYDVTIYAHYNVTPIEFELTLYTALDSFDNPDPSVGTISTDVPGPYYCSEAPYPMEITTMRSSPAYAFKHYTNEDGFVFVLPPTFNYTLTGDATFIAVYEKVPFTVTTDTDPDDLGGESGGGTYVIGDDVTLSAVEHDCYTFLGWYEGNTLISTDLVHTITNIPYGDRHFTAKYELDEYTLTVDIEGPGSVTVNGVLYTAPVTVDCGTVLTLVASPAGIFQGWSGDVTSANTTINVTMDEDVAVTATFADCDIVDDLDYSGVTAKRATVSWSAVAGAVGYEYSVNGGAWTATTDTFVNLMDLTPDTDYTVEVRTVCGPANYSPAEEVEFTTYRLGDVNCDGVINVQDVSILIGYIMDSANPTPCVEDAADFNEDGDVNVLDVVMLIQYILDGGSKAAPQSNTADIYLTPDMIRFESDGTLSGLQFELQGTNMDAVNLEMALEGYQLVYKSDGYTITGMIFSMDNQVIPAGMIDLMSVSGVSQIGWGEVFAANIGKQVEVNTHGATKGEFTLAVYPNPTRNLSDLTINFTLPTDAKVNLRLLDMSGRVVADLADAVFSKGMYPITLTDAAVVNPGVYFLQMTAMPENQRGELFRSEVKVVIIK